MQSDVTICRSQHIRNTTFDTSRKIELKNKMLIDFAVLFTLNRIKIQWYVMNWHTFTGIAQSDLEIIFRVRWNVFRAWNTPYFLINGKLTWISCSRITKHTVLQYYILLTCSPMSHCLLCSLATTIATALAKNAPSEQIFVLIVWNYYYQVTFVNAFSGTNSLK